MANRVAGKSGKLLYLYGITDRKARVEAGEGVDGHAEVEAIPCASFFCWISRVDADEYGE